MHKFDSRRKIGENIYMHTRSTGPITLLFVIIAIVAVTLIFGSRNQSSEPTSLESRFIDQNTQEKQELVERFELNDVQDIEKSIEKYENIHIPRVEEEMEVYRQKMIQSTAPEERSVYQEGLLNKLRERRAMYSTLEGYQQLRTWYYEYQGWILGGFEDVQIISDEVSIVD